MMERRRAGYHVSARGPLDNSDFRGATWKTETLDADGDGHPEVLFTGTNANGRASGYRLVLYVPRTRQTYSVHVEVDTDGQADKEHRQVNGYADHSCIPVLQEEAAWE